MNRLIVHSHDMFQTFIVGWALVTMCERTVMPPKFILCVYRSKHKMLKCIELQQLRESYGLSSCVPRQASYLEFSYCKYSSTHSVIAPDKMKRPVLEGFRPHSKGISAHFLMVWERVNTVPSMSRWPFLTHARYIHGLGLSLTAYLAITVLPTCKVGISNSSFSDFSSSG